MKKIGFAALWTVVGLVTSLGAEPLQTLPVGVSPRALALGEVLHRGETDLLVANFGSPTFIGQSTPPTQTGSSSVQVFSPSPMGLQLAATLKTEAGPRGLAAIGDGSGLQSILVSDYDAQKLEIFKWQSGSFQKTGEVPTLAQPVGLAAGSTSTQGGGIRFAALADYGAGEVSLFPLAGDGIGTRVDVRVSGNPVQVAIGDFDGDGQNEIAVADLTSDKIDLLKRPAGAPLGDLSGYQVVQTLSLPPGSFPSALAAADLNSDGACDLVAADFASNRLSVFLQQKGSGLVALPPLSTSGSHPNGLTVADLNGDGRPEVIVANRDSDSLDVFEWRGGALELAQTIKVADGPVSAFGPVEVAGLDSRRQGVLDLAVSHMRSNSVEVLAQGVTPAGEAPTPTPPSLGVGVTVTGPTFSARSTYAFPNPAHEAPVYFRFELAQPAEVRLQVFDITGKEVWDKILPSSQTQAGTNQLSWGIVNNAGQGLASGLYLFRVSVGAVGYTRELAILH